MEPLDPLLLRTRRHFFRDCGVGLGAMALDSLLSGTTRAAGSGSNTGTGDRAPLRDWRDLLADYRKQAVFIVIGLVVLWYFSDSARGALQIGAFSWSHVVGLTFGLGLVIGPAFWVWWHERE